MKTILFFCEKNPQFKNNFSLSEDFRLKIFSIKDLEITSLFKLFMDEKNFRLCLFYKYDINYLTIIFRLYNQIFENFIFIPNNIDLRC